MSEKFRQALGIGQSANTVGTFEINLLRQELTVNDPDLLSLGTVRGVLCTPLPRAYDEGPLGVSPVDKEERVVGMAVNIEAVTAAGAEMRGRLQNEQAELQASYIGHPVFVLQERNRKCEELRLDLDTKRRSAMALQEKYLKYKKKEHQDTEAVMHRAQTEEFKMNRIAQRYAEVEAEVFNALLTLIRDTVVLREYAAAALAILQRCFTLAYTAFDLNTTIPLPLLPPPAVSNGGMPPNHSGGGNSEAGNVRSSTASLVGGVMQRESTEDIGRPVQHDGLLMNMSFAFPQPNYSPSIATARSYNSTGGGAQEAKQNARPPTYGDDSDDEVGANPFQAKHQLDTDNPFSGHSELGSDTAHLASPTSH
ncbi:hypothetical protein QJQ45_016756 [Haematococcus lacustris]|nr:hypothetical protein QJQ45_016756 [Haematococcus lacustris]